jgi:hypothetical protein
MATGALEPRQYPNAQYRKNKASPANTNIDCRTKCRMKCATFIAQHHCRSLLKPPICDTFKHAYQFQDLMPSKQIQCVHSSAKTFNIYFQNSPAFLQCKQSSTCHESDVRLNTEAFYDFFNHLACRCQFIFLVGTMGCSQQNKPVKTGMPINTARQSNIQPPLTEFLS